MLTILLLLAFQCVDYSKNPAGCQPSTFDTPIGQMPSVRVNRQGNIDPFSSEEDARVGAAAMERELRLFLRIRLKLENIDRAPHPGPVRVPDKCTVPGNTQPAGIALRIEVAASPPAGRGVFYRGHCDHPMQMLEVSKQPQFPLHGRRADARIFFR